MENVIYEKSYPFIPVNVNEVYRYAGVGEITPELKTFVEECIDKYKEIFSYMLCYAICDISVNESEIDFGFCKVSSKTLTCNLKGCSRAVVFAATVGIEADRVVARLGSVSPSKAVIVQAFGAERIEALCNTFNNELKETYVTRPRFSPGYGDFPLEFQRDIFNLLSPHKRVGLSLNESLLMSPTKSVTAVIGIADEES